MAAVPKIVVRRLIGDGVHDSGEVLEIPDSLLDGIDSMQADEGKYDGDPWEFLSMISMQDGVISQSVTVASEAVLMGVPTLLVSNAERGFLDDVIDPADTRSMIIKSLDMLKDKSDVLPNKKHGNIPL